MTYEEAYAKLLNHANLVSLDAGNIAEEDSFLFALWKSGKDRTLPPIDKLYGDILACLEVVNRHLNGDTPSESLTEKASRLDRFLANAMWSITHNGWQYHRRWEFEHVFEQTIVNHLALTLWRISCAWGAVLDGDIDSLPDHVRNEEVSGAAPPIQPLHTTPQ